LYNSCRLLFEQPHLIDLARKARVFGIGAVDGVFGVGDAGNHLLINDYARNSKRMISR